MTSRRIAELEYNTSKLMKVHSKQISKLHELDKQKSELNFKLNEDIQENKSFLDRIPELEQLIKDEENKKLQAEKLKQE